MCRRVVRYPFPPCSANLEKCVTWHTWQPATGAGRRVTGSMVSPHPTDDDRDANRHRIRRPATRADSTACHRTAGDRRAARGRDDPAVWRTRRSGIAVNGRTVARDQRIRQRGREGRPVRRTDATSSEPAHRASDRGRIDSSAHVRTIPRHATVAVPWAARGRRVNPVRDASPACGTFRACVRGAARVRRLRPAGGQRARDRAPRPGRCRQRGREGAVVTWPRRRGAPCPGRPAGAQRGISRAPNEKLLPCRDARGACRRPGHGPDSPAASSAGRVRAERPHPGRAALRGVDAAIPARRTKEPSAHRCRERPTSITAAAGAPCVT